MHARSEQHRSAAAIGQLATRLLDARAAAVLNQMQVAELAGVDRWTVSRIEQGRVKVLSHPRLLSSLDRLEVALGLPPGHLTAQPPARATWGGAVGAALVARRRTVRWLADAAGVNYRLVWEYIHKDRVPSARARGLIEGVLPEVIGAPPPPRERIGEPDGK